MINSLYKKAKDWINIKLEEGRKRAEEERKIHEAFLQDILTKLSYLQVQTRRDRHNIDEIIVLSSFNQEFGFIGGTSLYLVDSDGRNYEVQKEVIGDQELLLRKAIESKTNVSVHGRSR